MHLFPKLLIFAMWMLILIVGTVDSTSRIENVTGVTELVSPPRPNQVNIFHVHFDSIHFEISSDTRYAIRVYECTSFNSKPSFQGYGGNSSSDSNSTEFNLFPSKLTLTETQLDEDRLFIVLTDKDKDLFDVVKDGSCDIGKRVNSTEPFKSSTNRSTEYKLFVEVHKLFPNITKVYRVSYGNFTALNGREFSLETPKFKITQEDWDAGVYSIVAVISKIPLPKQFLEDQDKMKGGGPASENPSGGLSYGTIIAIVVAVVAVVVAVGAVIYFRSPKIGFPKIMSTSLRIDPYR